MKLRDIAENYMSQKMRDAIVNSKALNQRVLPAVTDQPYEPSSGHNSSSHAIAAPSQTTGVPAKPRHRRYFGMETRLGAIRL